jgi:hypothetical protein
MKMRNAAGQVIDIDDADVRYYQDRGYTPETEDQTYARLKTEAEKPEDRGIIGTINAGATSLLSGATLGLSDYAFKGLLDEDQFKRLAAEREAHPIASGVGQVTGAIVPALASPTSVLGQAPSGLLSHKLAGVAAQGRAVGGATGVAATLGAAGVEGAIQNAGMYLSETALHDRELSAEALAGALGVGFGFGAAGGAAVLGIEGGTIAARRLFSRAQGTERAAADAQAAWQTQYQANLEAHQATADIAKAKLAEAQTAREQAQLAKMRAGIAADEAKRNAPATDRARQAGAATKSMLRSEALEANAAGPAAFSQYPDELRARMTAMGWSDEQIGALETARAPALSPAKEAELAQAVSEHDSALAELEAVLKRIEAPEIEPGVTSRAVPISEFGAPGQRGATGTPGPHEPARVSTTADLPPLPLPERSANLTQQNDSTSIPRFDPKTRTYHNPKPDELPTLPKELDEDEFKAFAAPWRASLDPDVEQAMQVYAANGSFSLINGPLRSGEGLTGVRTAALRDIVPVLDRGIAAARAPRDMLTYRGVNGVRSTKEWLDVAPGDVIVDRGFGSTSALSRVGGDYAKGMNVRRGVELRILVPEGYPAAPVPSEIFGAEREILLPRNTKYTVDRVVDGDNGRVVFVKAGPAAEGEASNVAAVARRDAKSIEEMTLSELDDRMSKIEGRIQALDNPAGRVSDEYGAARADFERAYQRQRDIKSGKVTEPKPEPVAEGPSGLEDLHRIASEALAPPAATDTLTGQLRSMQSRLGAGEDVKAMGAPARAEYAAGKAARTGEAAEHFRSQANARNYAGSAMASDEADTFFARLTRPKTRDAYVAQNIGRAMREEGSHAAALAKVEREWAEMSGEPARRGGAPTTPFDFEQSGGLRFDPKTRTYHNPTGQSTVPLMANAVNDVGEVAEIVTKYERASAKLTEALGPDAPPVAQEAAKAFRAAEEVAERRMMDRTTRAIDDHAEAPKAMAGKKRPAAVAPPPPDMTEFDRVLGGLPLPPTAAETLSAAKTAKADTGMTFKQAKLAETEARFGFKRADQALRDARGMDVPGATAEPEMSKLGAAAVAFGVAGEVGVPGIPKPSDLPIIGPLLGLYLKYRAVKAAAGRFIGRIPATGDARAAALVSRTKDKIATAVDRTLGLVAETAPKLRQPAVAAATVLGRRIFDDGEPDAPKGASTQELAAVRVREIANAVSQPQKVAALVRREMRGVIDPDLIAAAEQHLIKRFEYLNSVAPKQPAPNPYTMKKWVPSPAAAHDLAQRIEVVNDPESAFHNTTPAKAETLKAVSPRLLQLAQERLLARIGDIENPVPYKQRLRASRLFGVQLDDSLDPQAVSLVQGAFATTRAEPAPGPMAPPTSSVAADTNLTSMYQTGMDRRAMR